MIRTIAFHLLYGDFLGLDLTRSVNFDTHSRDLFMRSHLYMLVSIVAALMVSVAASPADLTPEEKLLHGVLLPQEMHWLDEIDEGRTPGIDPRQVAEVCRNVISGFATSVEVFIASNFEEFLEFKERMRQAGMSEKDFNDVVLKLVHTFQNGEQRILRAPFIEGKHAAENYLKGVIVWASNPRDVDRAIEVFYTQGPQQEVQLAKRNVISNLEYFAARMGWLAYYYDVTGGNRDSALRALAYFDATVGKELGLTYHHATATVTTQEADFNDYQYTMPRGIRYVDKPLSRFNLRFNNSRVYHFYGLRLEDEIAARQLSKANPNEMLLALGDQSTRLFFPLYLVGHNSAQPGHVSRFPHAADFVSVVERTKGNFEFVVREMKFSRGTTRVVDIEKALEQIRMTALALYARFGNEVPVTKVEIIVPERDRNLNGEMGNGYVVGRPLVGTPNVSEFWRRIDRKNVPVTVPVNGNSLPVRIRELPMTLERYDQIMLGREEEQAQSIP